MRLPTLRHLQLQSLPLRTAALTFYSFLAIVPLGALALAILEVLRLGPLGEEVRRFFLAQFGVVHGTSQQLDELLSRADAARVGGVAGILFLISSTALLLNIEEALNEIWRCRPRPFGWRLLVSLGVLTFGPLCLGVSLAITALLKRGLPFSEVHLPFLTFAIFPTALVFAGLFALYLYAPNTRVSPWAAAVGALVAAPGWEIAKQGYAAIAVRAYSQNAMVYGSLAAIPVLLLWMQLSWTIVLLGGRVAFGVQYGMGRGGG
jgi:membrane protein